MGRPRIVTAWVLMTAVLLIPHPGGASAPEFPLDPLNFPVVGADGAGNLVIAGDRDDGDLEGVGARRFDASGAPLGAEFLVNSSTTGRQHVTDIAVTDSGSFVVVWTTGFIAYGVRARRFDGTGAPLGGEFVVNATQPGGRARVAADTSGGFLVVWKEPSTCCGGSEDVFARHYDAAGTPSGPDFQVNTASVQDLPHFAVSADADDNFVIVWTPDPLGPILARRYDGAGAPLTGEFQVAVGGYPQVDRTPGGFLLSWVDSSLTGPLRARSFDTAGLPVGSEFQLTGTNGLFYDMAVGPTGRIFVVYRKEMTSPFSTTMVGRLLESDGTPASDSFTLAAIPNRDVYQGVGRTTSAGGDDFAAVWMGDAFSSTPGRPFARRITPRRFPGKQCQVTEGGTGVRRIRCEGQERSSPISVLGDPVSGGATLRVVADGATATDQTFTLPPGSAWQPLGGSNAGFIYRDSAGVGGPVKLLRLRKSSSGTLGLKAVLFGTASTPVPGVQVSPPNLGTSMVIALDIGGNTYCTGLGAGQGGGTVLRNDDRAFKLQTATSDGVCP